MRAWDLLTLRWFMSGPPVAIGATRILIEEIQRYQAEGVTIEGEYKTRESVSIRSFVALKSLNRSTCAR